MSENNILEVLFASDTNDHQVTCSAWDYRTGTNLMNYKGGGSGAASRTLCLYHSQYVLAANLSKPLLHVWPINAQEQLSTVRFVMPGTVTALALSPDDCYLVAGIQEILYIWHKATGRMKSILTKHYQTVTCIRFTDDSSHFASGGKDGTILVWNLTRAVSRSFDNENTQPLYSFNDHGLPVTDIHIGAGGMRCYMYTVSLDRSSKIYDLSDGSLLLNVVFNEGLQSLTVNGFETQVFVGSNAGSIFQVHTDSIPRVKEYHKEEENKTFSGHSTTSIVNCLALSLDGQTLVSGASDGQILVWNIPSRQLVRTLTHKGAITNLCLKLMNTMIFNPEHKQPLEFRANLKRMMDPVEADEDEVIEILVTANDLENDENRYFSHVKNSSSKVYDSSCSANQNELESLRKEVRHLHSVNKNLFEISAKQLLRNHK
ncbi:WD repeat-containing protein 18 [Glossina fuscipes fuscipes]